MAEAAVAGYPNYGEVEPELKSAVAQFAGRIYLAHVLADAITFALGEATAILSAKLEAISESNSK